MLYQETPNLPDSAKFRNWSKIDQCLWNKTWSSCRKYIRHIGCKQRKNFWTCSKVLNETGSKLHITVTGPRRYYVDLKQDGLELPAGFCFTLLNEKLFLQMTLEEVQKYQKQKKEVGQEKEKKRKKEE